MGKNDDDVPMFNDEGTSLSQLLDLSREQDFEKQTIHETVFLLKWTVEYQTEEIYHGEKIFKRETQLEDFVAQLKSSAINLGVKVSVDTSTHHI